MYVILTDFDEKNTNSGPTVRSLAILKELEKLSDLILFMGKIARKDLINLSLYVTTIMHMITAILNPELE